MRPRNRLARGLSGKTACAVAMAVLLSACSSGSGSPTPDGSPFAGDGYTLTVPAQPKFDYSRIAGMDSWVVTGATPEEAFGVLTPLTNLLPIEQSLEGALGRAKQGIESGGQTFKSATAVSEPAGPSYVVLTDDPTIEEYVFYHAGVGIILLFKNVPAGVVDQVAASFRFA